jgi:hypothetical protein
MVPVTTWQWQNWRCVVTTCIQLTQIQPKNHLKNLKNTSKTSKKRLKNTENRQVTPDFIDIISRMLVVDTKRRSTVRFL